MVPGQRERILGAGRQKNEREEKSGVKEKERRKDDPRDQPSRHPWSKSGRNVYRNREKNPEVTVRWDNLS